MAARLFSIGLCVGLAAFAATAAEPAEAATVSAAPGSVGYDISFPQCSANSPRPPSNASFTVVGVTGGTAYSANNCFAQEYTASSAEGVATGVYVNTGNPGHTSASWQAAAVEGPETCGNAANDHDYGCAYDYGYQAGVEAVNRALAANPSAAGGIWWLDVETGNSWLPTGKSITTASAADQLANVADLQGELNALYDNKVAEVGIYSTALQWNEITGNDNQANEPWFEGQLGLGTFTHPLTSAPLWIPTGSFDKYKAYQACSQSFTGARTVLAQYLAYVTSTTALDADLVCGGAVPVSIAGAPRGPVAKAGKKRGTVNLSWQAPSSTGGEPITGYVVYRGTSGGHLSAYRTVSCTTASCSWTDSGAKHGKRYYYKVAAVNEVGTGHQSSWVTAKGK